MGGRRSVRRNLSRNNKRKSLSGGKKGKKGTKRTMGKRMRGGALDDGKLKEILEALIKTVRSLELHVNPDQRPMSKQSAEGTMVHQIDKRWDDLEAYIS